MQLATALLLTPFIILAVLALPTIAAETGAPECYQDSDCTAPNACPAYDAAVLEVYKCGSDQKCHLYACQCANGACDPNASPQPACSTRSVQNCILVSSTGVGPASAETGSDGGVGAYSPPPAISFTAIAGMLLVVVLAVGGYVATTRASEGE